MAGLLTAPRSLLTYAKKSVARFIYRSVSYSVRNAYEAGSTGRRLGKWNPSSSGPNASVIGDLERLRARSRELVRNNPWISRGINSWVANEIGCAITFKSAAPDEEFRKRADELWERQCSHFDADGTQDFYGMLSQIVRTRRDAGEIFIRRRLRNASDGLPVPIQYQLLEPEFCPVWYSESSASRRIYAGIEFNLIGKRTAYWMYRAHPGDGIFFTDVRQLELVPIPASQVLHHFKQLRPGQIRGVPAIVQAMIRAKDFDEYDDAELVRKKNRAAFTGAIQRPNYNPDVDDKFDPLTGEPIDKDYAGVPVSNIEAGSFFTTLPGEEVKLFDGDTSGSGYSDFVRQQLLGIGAGQDVPYEFISGDFSKLNDRTLRVVLAEYHRVVEQDRWQVTIPQVCYPVWRDFIATAIMTGALQAPADYAADPERYYKVECHPEGWPYLHELQDANADVIRLNSGLTSRKRILSEQGIDVREVDEENAEDKKRAAELGLKYEGQTADVAPDEQPTDDDNNNAAPGV